MASYNNFPTGFTLPHILTGGAESTSILVGLSGGADSTALLSLLCKYGKEGGAKIYAAHINHGIRGKEADRDEEFCRSLCSSLGVELFVLRADLPTIAKERKESIETAARAVRYEYFDAVMAENNISLLATAHNANDNFETMLFNMARGTALSGLCGIPEARRTEYGTVIRPILYMTKDDIYAYCRENSLSFVVDSTNSDSDYTRNKIRNDIIPLLCEINGGAVKNAARLSKTLRKDSLCLESMKELFLTELCENREAEAEKLAGSPEAISSRVLVELYEGASGGTLEGAHIAALLELCRRAVPHSSVTLPNGFEGVIKDGRLLIRKKEAPAVISPYIQALVEGSNRISQTNCEIIIEYSQSTKNIYKKSISTTIDFDKICGSLYAKGRTDGDKILMCGMHKSVKKLMNEKKIPLELRSRLPIICDDNGILFIPLVGVRDGMRAQKSSENIISFHFYAY